MNDEQMREFLQMVLQKLKEEDSSKDGAAPNVTAKDILLDFKLYADDVYEGKTEEDENSLVIVLRNGKKFRVTVHEIKLQLEP